MLLLAIAFVALAGACDAPPPRSPRDSDGPATRVTILDLVYEPAELDIPAGSTVTWVNEDVAAHDVASDDGSFASPTLQQGDTFSVTFDQPGSWSYTCTIHPEMTGVVSVR